MVYYIYKRGARMYPDYYVISPAGDRIPVTMREAQKDDYEQTTYGWQSNWNSSYIQQPQLKKYAMETTETHELLGLCAFHDMPESVLLFVTYMESEPGSNPNITNHRAYSGIGAVMLAFAIQLSIDNGYGGTIALKAKTSELREHYIQCYGAIPFSHYDPFLLLIDGEAAQNLFVKYLKEG